MKSIQKLMSAFMFFLIAATGLYAGNILITEGKEFYLCFERNYKQTKSSGNDELKLALFITSSYDSKVNISINELNYEKEIFVKAGSFEKIDIDNSCAISSFESIDKRVVHISSDNPVAVYGLNRRFQTTDTFTGIPVGSLGMEYLAVCYNISVGYTPQFVIVATEDNTEVTILPKAKTITSDSAALIKIILNSGEAYQVSSEQVQGSRCDLTGSFIKANKKIAFFSGHQCAYVPSNIIACNHLVEQIPPIELWGTEYYAVRLAERKKSTLRIIASEDNTTININNERISLNAGEFYENNAQAENIAIKSDKPVLAAQYSQGFRNGDSVGDPMMFILRPKSAFQKQYIIATPVTGSWNHYINATIPKECLGTFTIDGEMPDDILYERLDDKYMAARIKIPYGSHTVKCSSPFGISMYGFGYGVDAFDAYGNM